MKVITTKVVYRAKTPGKRAENGQPAVKPEVEMIPVGTVIESESDELKQLLASRSVLEYKSGATAPTREEAFQRSEKDDLLEKAHAAGVKGVSKNWSEDTLRTKIAEAAAETAPVVKDETSTDDGEI